MSSVHPCSKLHRLPALFLIALIGSCLALRALAADPFRLDRVAVTRFTAVGTDKLLREIGVLTVKGELRWRPASEEPRPANAPNDALNRTLISIPAWRAYYGLGSNSLMGFQLEEGSVVIRVGTEEFFAIAPNPDGVAYLNDGRLINISTRAVLADAGSEIIAGFVIENRPRAVLVRAVGPGLAKFGVTNAAPDPFLSVKRNGLTEHFNDNWSTRSDRVQIVAATAQAGAFPLDPGSADAARVLVLEPGVYTVHVTTAGPAIRGGAVLLEVYSLPDGIDYTEPAS
ncbi:MAG: hypothetical protein NTV51_26550 [Verrucomicrobia bacterium]|nr:hypothetical protein [Verrucomicrobiota bacterium]